MSPGGIEAYEVSHPFRETPWGEIRWAQEELTPQRPNGTDRPQASHSGPFGS